ncbi:hypothetical protein H072_111 [Dactylellina haptotyla CBS 200.50]|uniref:Uncharacterized protein n=1 Tax=Dactylellina haptotyla (strain CBS 200.50) TaxID=1284197 RepID=S8ARV4_DACHA|nr:hypothetical protein H072_111 [Dactylellina haptotyla CBS 200.50]
MDVNTSTYYKSYGLGFQCLDENHVLEQADAEILDPDLQNLIIDYGPNNAWCGWNFKLEDTSGLIESWAHSEAQGFKTRWIMLFNVHKQREFAVRLLEKYNLSARLIGSLISSPGEGNLEIAKRLWHWSSVEHGEKFRIVGYNTLFNLDKLNLPPREAKPAGPEPKTNDASRTGDATGIPSRWAFARRRKGFSNDPVLPISGSPRLGIRSKNGGFTSKNVNEHSSFDNISANDEDALSNIHYHPRMLRLWMWIIVTADGTVISIHEPFPINGKPKVELDRENAAHIRRNLRMVLRCLSETRLSQQVETPSRDAKISIEEGALLIRKTDGPTSDLLLYYLFDDWFTTWGIVVQRAHPYSKDLSSIREQDPQLEHIDKLHDIVRRLASLRRIYQSYELVINRLLDEAKDFFDADSPLSFRPAAAFRINRLKYRVRYLAIPEIEDCESETQGLISLVRQIRK